MDIRVREIEIEDLEMIMRWRMREDVTRYLSTNPELDLETQINWWKKQKESENSMHWLVVVDDRPAGVINLADINWAEKITSSGFYIGEPSLRSFHLCTLLHMNLFDFIFDELQFNELRSKVFSINSTVIKLNLRWGLKIVKEVKSEVMKDGILYDITYMNLKNYEWKTFKGNKHYSKIQFTNRGILK